MIMARQGNRPTRRVRDAAAVLAGLLSLLCGQSLAAELRYELDVSDDLASVSVRALLPDDGRPLKASDGQTSLLEDLRSCSGVAIRPGEGLIPTEGAAGCLSYRYPLLAQSGRRSPPVAADVKVTTPGEWLWLPELEPSERVTIDLLVPAWSAISVPWRPLGGGRYELSPSPGSATGTAVFGRFALLTLDSGGGQLQIAALDGPDLRLQHEKVLEWLAVAAADVAGVSGRFPNPSVQVLVQPVRSHGNSPVPFGYVIRDGGEAVRFYVDPDRSIDDYHADWTATHEFAHLLLPYVRSREKWVSEGFASYYQNVLLARRGTYDEEEVWARLSRSFGRADAVADPPRLDRLHERSFRDVRMLVYWSGAALALKADIRLRELGPSLDQVLAQLATCCLPSQRIWTAAEFFEQLDAFSPEPVFVPLYQAFMDDRGMPDLEPLYRDLGIRLRGGAIELHSEGRLVAVREAIMRPETVMRSEGG